MINTDSIAAPAAVISDAKAYLRIDHGLEDGLLGQLGRSAIDLAEGFTGQMLIARAVSEVRAAAPEWKRLARTPVRSIESVTLAPLGAAESALPVGAYAIDIDGHGDGWVRVPGLTPGTRVAVHYQAGMASGWDALPPALVQGVVRLIAHLFSHRDQADPAALPSAVPIIVAALWRPWRRMALR